MTDPAIPPAQTPPQQAGVVEDFVDIFASLAAVFARRAKAGAAVPYFVVAALLIVLFFVNRNIMGPIMEAEMQKGIEAATKANPQVTVEMVRKSMEVTFMVGGIVGPPLALLVLGLIAFGVGRALGGTLSYGTALLIASFSWIPRVVESVLASVQGLALDTTKLTSHYQLQLGVARFLDPASTNVALLALVGRVDLITLWVTLLFALGLVHAGKVPKEKMILAGVVMWIVGSIFPVWGAIRAG